ncbi:MAG: DUF368 domain-containing protein [Leptospirales bacterium]
MKQYQLFKDKAILAVKGFMMGTADVVPGVSGGTIALISGIYEHLITALSSVKISHAKDLFFLIFTRPGSEKRVAAIHSLTRIPWNFLLPLMFGILSGAMVFFRIMPYLLETHPLYTYSFFFGLILFSLTIPYKHMHKHLYDFAILIFFAFVTFMVTVFIGEQEGTTNLFYIFFSGALAICAMILPGISGAYILLILGEYHIITDSLEFPFDLPIVLTFIAGMVIGLLSFVRLLKSLLYHHHSRTMAALTGAMVGSMYKLLPFPHIKGSIGTSDYAIFAAMALLGMLFIFAMERAALAVKDPEPPI